MKWCLPICLSVFALAGCGARGPAIYPVTGKVTIDGTPAADVSVTFTPVGKNLISSGGKTDAQGNYTLYTPQGKMGAIAGSHVVTLSGGTSASSDKPENMYKREGSSADGKSSPTMTIPKGLIPEKYTKEGGLENKTVEAKSNQINFDLSSK